MTVLIETNRLYLREFIPDDAADVYQLNADPQVIKYTGDLPFLTVQDAQAFLLQYKDYLRFGMGRWACILKESNEFLGWCGLKRLSETGEVDLGYRFSKKYWGQGFATEAGIACLHYGFGQLKLDEIIGRAQTENKASIRVLQKVGMHYVGNFDFDLHPGMKYRINKIQFLQQQKLQKT